MMDMSRFHKEARNHNQSMKFAKPHSLIQTFLALRPCAAA
jgi:hypothetical protein